MKKLTILAICLTLATSSIFASWFDDAVNATKDAVSKTYNSAANWTTNTANDVADWTKNAANDTANWASGTYNDVASSIKVLVTYDKIQTPEWIRGAWYNLDKNQSLYITENNIVFEGSALNLSLDNVVQQKKKDLSDPKITNLSKEGLYTLSVTDKKGEVTEVIANISKSSDNTIRAEVPGESLSLTFFKDTEGK